MDRRTSELDEIAALEAELQGVSDAETAGDPEAVEQPPEPAPASVSIEPDPEPDPADFDPAEGDDGVVTGQPAPVPAAAKPGKEQRMVPYGAMFAERAKKEDLAEKLKLERERVAAIEEERKVYLEEVKAFRDMRMAEQKAKDEAKKAQESDTAKPKPMELVPVPDWNEDPAAHVKALNENATAREHNLRLQMEEQARVEAERYERLNSTVTESVSEYKARLEAEKKALAEQAEIQQIASTVRRHEVAYRDSEAPDYDEASKFLRASIAQEYMTMGLPPEAAVQAMNQQLFNMSKVLMSDRKDPIPVWYNLAKLRGWTGGAQADPEPAGALAAPVTAAPARQPGKPSVETMKRGMASSAGLAQVAQSGGGIAPDPEDVLAKVLDMKESDFAKYQASGKLDKLIAQLEGR
jgi:hypothetical protein